MAHPRFVKMKLGINNGIFGSPCWSSKGNELRLVNESGHQVEPGLAPDTRESDRGNRWKFTRPPWTKPFSRCRIGEDSRLGVTR